MSRLRVNEIGAKTGNIVSMESGTQLYSPGSVVQVVNTLITTPTSVGFGSSLVKVTVPNLQATITPKSESSKIYITVRWFGEFNPQSANYNTMWGIFRDGVPVLDPTSTGGASGISMGSLSYWVEDASSTPEVAMFDYLDSPATTAAVTYSVYIESAASGTLFTNRVVNAGTGASLEYGSSSITLWEIAQ